MKTVLTSTMKLKNIDKKCSQLSPNTNSISQSVSRIFSWSINFMKIKVTYRKSNNHLWKDNSELRPNSSLRKCRKLLSIWEERWMGWFGCMREIVDGYKWLLLRIWLIILLWVLALWKIKESWSQYRVNCRVSWKKCQMYAKVKTGNPCFYM